MSESKSGPKSGKGIVKYDRDTIKSLVDDLDSKNRPVLQTARESLAGMGESAVTALVKALADRRARVRWEAGKLLDEIHVAWAQHADAETIEALVADLSSEDGLVRVMSRRALVTIGGRSVARLTDALKSTKAVQRWEAAKALGDIGDPAAIGSLIRALEDEMFDVRWLAGEGLIAIGRRAIPPLVRDLVERRDSVWLMEGAHHVLHGFKGAHSDPGLGPVIRALEGPEPAVELPVAAENALKLLEAKPKRRKDQNA